MKIVIIISQFPPKWLAGMEIATYSIAEHLARLGHDVHVITSLDEGLTKETCEKGFFIHRLPMIHIGFFGTLFFWVSTFRKIKQIRPNIVQVQSISLGIPAVFSKKILSISYAVWGRGSDVYLPNWFTKMISKTVIKNADLVIALTNNMKEIMKTIYNRDIVVVPNGIEVESFIDQPGEFINQTFGQTIMFVGRLHPVKGLQYLLQAMEIVIREIPEARLMVIGEGKEKENLECLTNNLGLKDHVDFVGMVPHEKIHQYMHRADLFVLPSISEGFPVTILEAMACGLPIIATCVGGVPDIIVEETNGFLVKVNDPYAIAGNIILLLRDNVLRTKISDNNKLLVKKYTWENVIVELEKKYELSIS